MSPLSLEQALLSKTRLTLGLFRGLVLLAWALTVLVDLVEGGPLTWVLARNAEFIGTLLLLEWTRRATSGWRLRLVLMFVWFGFSDALCNGHTLPADTASASSSLLVVGLGFFPAPWREGLLRGGLVSLAIVAGLVSGGITAPSALGVPFSLAIAGAVLSHIQHTAEARQLELHQRALAASEARSRFLARMSHEMRTPLNGVMGMLAQARAQARRASQREALDIAMQSSEVLLAMMDDVLAFAAGEREGVSLKPVATDAGALTRKTISGLAIQRPDLDVRVDIPAPLPERLRLDPQRFQQILNKLVGNALRFTPSGAVRVTLGWDEEAGVLTVTVRDTGPGLPEDVAALLDAFAQGDDGARRHHDGAGMGLALVRQITAAMGGRLQAHDLPEGGACFTVTLPLEPVAAPSPRPAPAALPTALSGRVLIVEDNTINRMVLRRAIETLGLTVDEASDGVEGLRCMAACDYPLVFMDHHMPNMDGLEATRRARERGFDGTIIAITAVARPEARARSLAAGMNGHLSKPVRPDQIARLVAHTLGSRQHVS